MVVLGMIMIVQYYYGGIMYDNDGTMLQYILIMVGLGVVFVIATYIDMFVPDNPS